MRWLDDEEMSDRVAEWLRGGAVNQNFLSIIARAAIVANEFEYELLRPALIEMENAEVKARCRVTMAAGAGRCS
jgi:hypothetical protein